ncbi:MAG TPA: tetratricopeptide repeat protein [Nitrospiria bacterium]|jgi:Tfp pilus assembly protein PilF|nr:tetratricopeptide repeat protein [Nitrospiria bacterium]
MGLLLAVGGCGSLPRIVVLHDPLTPREHVQLGVSYESQKDWGSAEKQYQAALAQDPDYLPALANLGNVYAQQEQYASAEKMYRRALQRDPNQPMANNNLAWIYILQGIHLAEAGERIDRALAADPGHRAFYEDTRALLFLSLGQPARARAASLQAETAAGSELPGFAEQHDATRSKIDAALSTRGSNTTEAP